MTPSGVPSPIVPPGKLGLLTLQDPLSPLPKVQRAPPHWGSVGAGGHCAGAPGNEMHNDGGCGAEVGDGGTCISHPDQ